jgi:hypothetical protein
MITDTMAYLILCHMTKVVPAGIVARGAPLSGAYKPACNELSSSISI